MAKNKQQRDIALYVEALTEAGGELYEVGGPVRDRLMDRPVKDHDFLCRHLSMKQVTRLLKPFGRVAAVGKLFGVIKFSPHKLPGAAFDIALPRRESSTGVGHRDFEVDFDPELPVEDDLGRRDFTVNAMAMALADEKLIDPFGGQSDIKKKTLRMVFPRAFEEDPLRLVRGIQFAARLGFTIEPATLEAMRKNAHLIETVSPERISLELVKLMGAPKPSVGFDLMVETGLLKYILPELIALKGVEQDKQPGEDVYDHTMRALDAARADHMTEHKGDAELLFAVLLHDIGKATTARYHPPAKRTVFFGHQMVSAKLGRRWMQKMKLTSAGVATQEVITLIEHHMFETKAHFTDRAIRRFVSKVGQELVFKLLDLRLADNRGGKHPHGIKGVLRMRKRVREELAKKPPFGPADLAIDGNVLKEIGIPEGPAIGAALHALVEHVLDDPSLNTREQLLALIGEMRETLQNVSNDAHPKRKETRKLKPQIPNPKSETNPKS